MRIALFHGFELTGSGSNEYTRYLSRALALAGHEVHVLCREPSPEAIVHVERALRCQCSHRGTASPMCKGARSNSQVILRDFRPLSAGTLAADN